MPSACSHFTAMSGGTFLSEFRVLQFDVPEKISDLFIPPLSTKKQNLVHYSTECSVNYLQLKVHVKKGSTRTAK
jgi:hypothetical protein